MTRVSYADGVAGWMEPGGRASPPAPALICDLRRLQDHRLLFDKARRWLSLTLLPIQTPASPTVHPAVVHRVF